MLEEQIDVSPLIKRRMVWDVLPCTEAAGFISRVGLVPGSDGGDEMEHRQSHSRINQLLPIVRAVDDFSRLAGEVAGRAILENQGIEIDSQSEGEINKYTTAVMASCRTVIANLIENGVLHIGGHA